MDNSNIPTLTWVTDASGNVTARFSVDNDSAEATIDSAALATKGADLVEPLLFTLASALDALRGSK